MTTWQLTRETTDGPLLGAMLAGTPGTRDVLAFSKRKAAGTAARLGAPRAGRRAALGCPLSPDTHGDPGRQLPDPRVAGKKTVV